MSSGDAAAPVEDACAGGSPYTGEKFGLRVAAIFIILVTSMFGTLFPIFSRRVKALGVPERLYEFLKYFGSGVIIATAFIHLLAPAFDALGSPCLTGAWTEYDFAPAIAMCSVFAIFIAELIAHRAGAAYLRRQGLHSHDPHSSAGNEIGHTTHGAHVELPNTSVPLAAQAEALDGSDIAKKDLESQSARQDDPAHEVGHAMDEQAMRQILGVVILEAGVVFHSLIIGLTLAVDEKFTTLFIVLIFHQMFEGLGLGSRLAVLPLPSRLNWVPFAGGVLYSCITPLGVAIGLGVRTTYNPESATASIVSGVLDALAAGILMYTGLVELLAHDFIFNRSMAVEASDKKVAFAVCCMLIGAGIMALLGRWA